MVPCRIFKLVKHKNRDSNSKAGHLPQIWAAARPYCQSSLFHLRADRTENREINSVRSRSHLLWRIRLSGETFLDQSIPVLIFRWSMGFLPDSNIGDICSEFAGLSSLIISWASLTVLSANAFASCVPSLAALNAT